uniref:Uncharacterized protein n=1 Tax=Arundo donax TaxID=35708 RepID=A0A0A8ZK49_ARUDO
MNPTCISFLSPCVLLWTISILNIG